MKRETNVFVKQHSFGLDSDTGQVIGNVLTRRALETQILEVRSGLGLRTPVDAVTAGDDHNLVEELVDLVTGLVCRMEKTSIPQSGITKGECELKHVQREMKEVHPKTSVMVRMDRVYSKAVEASSPREELSQATTEARLTRTSAMETRYKNKKAQTQVNTIKQEGRKPSKETYLSLSSRHSSNELVTDQGVVSVLDSERLEQSSKELGLVILSRLAFDSVVRRLHLQTELEGLSDS